MIKPIDGCAARERGIGTEYRLSNIFGDGMERRMRMRWLEDICIEIVALFQKLKKILMKCNRKSTNLIL